MHRGTLPATLGIAAVVGAILVCGGGCRNQAGNPPPEDPLSGEAATVPPGKLKVRLSRKPEPLAADAKEAHFEWTILASIQPEPGEHAKQGGWSVTRYALTVRIVGDDEARTIPEAERVRPKAGMVFVRHEGEASWAKFAQGTAGSRGTAGFAYHKPGTPRALRVGGGGFVSTIEPGREPTVEVFKPWTYAVEAKAGRLADMVQPLLTVEVVIDLPGKVDILRVGEVVTTLDLRP